MQQLEEHISQLLRTVEELSDVVARQQGEIDQLTRRVAMLMQREAQRDTDQGAHIFTGDERPPHY